MLSDISRSAVVQDLASEWSSAEAMVTTETGVDVLVLLWTLCSGLLATSCAEPLTDPLAKALRIVLLVTFLSAVEEELTESGDDCLSRRRRSPALPRPHSRWATRSRDSCH